MAEVVLMDTVKCGIPQGFILGPLIFRCIDSLPNVAPVMKAFGYADDTALVATGIDTNEISDKLNDALLRAKA